MRNIITTIVLFLLGTVCFAQEKESAAPTQLDTATGKTWQAQWSTSYSNRGILEIE